MTVSQSTRLLSLIIGLMTAAVFSTTAAAHAEFAQLAHLEEESVPAADLPSPTATPTAGAMPSAGAMASPGVAASPGAIQPASTGAAAPTAPPVAAPSSAALDLGPTPLPTPVDVAPLEIGTIAPTPNISDSSLQELIDKAPSPARGASLRQTEEGRIELSKGKPESAARSLAHAVSIDPSNSYAYFFLGRAYLLKKNYTQAMNFFKRAEIGFGSIPPWLGETFAFEGLTYEESGNSVAAQAAYQQALDATPGNLMARVGYTRLSAGNEPATAGADAVNGSEPPPAPAASPAPPPPSVPTPAPAAVSSPTD